jgi:hypothetical protein
MDEKKIAQVAINNQIEQHGIVSYDKALSGVSNIYFIFLNNLDIFKMFQYFFVFLIKYRSCFNSVFYSTSIRYEKNESASCFRVSSIKETDSLTN